MIKIRPVSDLRNKFPEIEELVNKGDPIFLTKNGYGAMVVLNLQQYANLSQDIELKLDEADIQARSSNVRCKHKDVFKRLRSRAGRCGHR